jgi:hypothetical protein
VAKLFGIDIDGTPAARMYSAPLRGRSWKFARMPAFGQTRRMRSNSCLDTQRVESTVRYLGIEIDDAIEIAEKIEV